MLIKSYFMHAVHKIHQESHNFKVVWQISISVYANTTQLLASVGKQNYLPLFVRIGFELFKV